MKACPGDRDLRQGIVQSEPGQHDPRFLPLGDVGAFRYEITRERHRLASTKSSKNEVLRRVRDIPGVTAQGGRWGRTFTGCPEGTSEQLQEEN